MSYQRLRNYTNPFFRLYVSCPLLSWLRSPLPLRLHLYLYLSADPSSPSWEECVRSWASKLGVWAQPSPSTPDTPLATPPPDDPGAQEQHWLCRETTTAAPDVHQQDQQPTAEQKTLRKEAAQPKRTGSFARGFLLGLGGFGVGNSSSSKVEVEVRDHTRDTIAAPHSILPEVQTRNPVTEKGVKSVPVEVPDNNCASSRRERWVKGFESAPSSPTNSSTDGDDSIDASKSSSDGRLTRSASTSESDKRTSDGVSPAAAANVSPRDTRASDQSAEAWLETVYPSAIKTMNRNNSVDSVSGGVASTKAPGKKKKNKGSKAKGKGGKAKANKASVSKANTMTKDPTVDASTSGSTKQGEDKSALNVTFGDVTLLEFTRDVGGCTVPSDGTWALSLGLPFRETRVDVDGYEASKAEVGSTAMVLRDRTR